MTHKEIVPVDKDAVHQLAYDYVVLEQDFKKLMDCVKRVIQERYTACLSYELNHLDKQYKELCK